MNQFGSHHRARTAPSSSSSSTDETPALPLRLASHFPIHPQSQSRSGQDLTVPTWQPNLQYNIPTSVYKHNTPPAKRLRTRSTPIKKIELGFIPLPCQNKGPLASDKTINLKRIGSGEVRHHEYMDLDSDVGWDKENTSHPSTLIAYNQSKSYTFKPQHLELITSMDSMNPVDQDSPPVISATSLDLYLNDVHPTQMQQQNDDHRHLPSPPSPLDGGSGTEVLYETFSYNFHGLQHNDDNEHGRKPGFEHDSHVHSGHHNYNNDDYHDTYDTHDHYDQDHGYHDLSSPIPIPSPSPTLSEHTRRRLSYGDPHPQPDYSIFGMIDRILTPKMRTPDRLVLPSVDGEGEVLLLDRAFDESDSFSSTSPEGPKSRGTERMEQMGIGFEIEIEIGRRNRMDTPRSPGKPQPVTPEQSTSTSGAIRTGENGILLTPGDKEGMTGLGIVCRPRSGSGYSTPTPASSSIPEAGTGSVFGSAGSVARRRVLTFSREEQEDDTYNPIEPDNLVLKSSFQSRSPQHKRYRTTSSAYALPPPVNRNRKKQNNIAYMHGGHGRAYRQRMGKYPFNNPFARILFFSTVVILLAAIFGVGGFVDDGTDAGVAEYDLWMRGGTDMGMRGNGYGDGNQLRGWSGMVGDETQVFGIVGLPATPSGGISGDVFYREQQPIHDHYESSYSHLEKNDEEEEKDKGYKLHKRRVHQHKYKRNGWRAKVRRAGAALHSHAEE